MPTLTPKLNQTLEQARDEHFGRGQDVSESASQEADIALASVDEHLAALDREGTAVEDNPSLMRRIKSLAPYVGAIILGVPAVPYFVHRLENVANPKIDTRTQTVQVPDYSHYGGTENVVITTQTPNYGG